MVEEGDVAPEFELPAVRDGEFEEIALAEYLGEDVIILAFYPGDFNPACDGTSSGIGEFDLFTMQKDITILAVSGDSVFSHRAFADEYDLHIPLLADVRGEVAAEYGVESSDQRYATRRAVFVIDHTGEVEFRWIADEFESLPRTDEIQSVIENIGDDETAQARYRVGHAHYVEGRRAFTSAMSAYKDREWMLSSRDFAQAADEFDEAREEFNTAVRFSDDPEATRYFERAERKAEALWRAANWLNDSTSAFASGEGRRGEELRQDAEGPLETARDIHEPPDPDDFPPEEDPREAASEETAFLGAEEEDVDTTLELDEPAEAPETPAAASAEPTDSGEATSQGESASESTVAEATGETATASAAPGPERGSDSADGSEAPDDGDTGEADDEDIDDAELEAITAELEEQNESAQADAPEQPSEETEDDSDVATIDDDIDDEDLELELADPTDGEGEERAIDGNGAGEGDDEEEEADDEAFVDDIGSGDHGVPDSL